MDHIFLAFKKNNRTFFSKYHTGGRSAVDQLVQLFHDVLGVAAETGGHLFRGQIQEVVDVVQHGLDVLAELHLRRSRFRFLARRNNGVLRRRFRPFPVPVVGLRFRFVFLSFGLELRFRNFGRDRFTFRFFSRTDRFRNSMRPRFPVRSLFRRLRPGFPGSSSFRLLPSRLWAEFVFRPAVISRLVVIPISIPIPMSEPVRNVLPGHPLPLPPGRDLISQGDGFAVRPVVVVVVRVVQVLKISTNWCTLFKNRIKNNLSRY